MYIHITYKSIRKEESVYDEKILISKNMKLIHMKMVQNNKNFLRVFYSKKVILKNYINKTQELQEKTEK